MFSPNTIPVGRIALAYDLNGTEIDELIKHIGASINCHWISSLIDIKAFHIASFFPKLHRYQYSNVYELKKTILHDYNINLEAKRPLIDILIPICVQSIGTNMDYHSVWQGQGDTFFSGDEALFYIFRDLSLLNKIDSTKFLAEFGFTQIKQVKGLPLQHFVQNEKIRETEQEESVSSEVSALAEGSEPALQTQLLVESENCIKETEQEESVSSEVSAPAEGSEPALQTQLLVESENCIIVNDRIAAKANGSGKTQLQNTLKENPEAVRRVEILKLSKISLFEIDKLMRGGKRVRACLLFPQSASPEAAYKSYQRMVGKNK